jgi:hypothetical protein
MAWLLGEMKKAGKQTTTFRRRGKDSHRQATGQGDLAETILECGKGLPLWYFVFWLATPRKRKIPKRQSLAALQNGATGC